MSTDANSATHERVGEQERALKRDIALKSRDFASVRALIGVLLAESKFAEAEVYAEALDIIAPAQPAVKSLLTQIYCRNGNYEAASIIAQQLVDLDPNNVQSWELAASTFFSAQKFEQAAEAYRAAFFINPALYRGIKQYFYLKNPLRRQTEIAATFRSLLNKKGIPPASLSTIYRYLLLLDEAEARAARGLPEAALDFQDWRLRISQDDLRLWREAAAAWYAEDPSDGDAAADYINSALLDGHLIEAEPTLEVLRRALPTHVGTSFALSREFYASLEQESLQDILKGLPPARVLAETSMEGRRTFFIGCDQVYFDRYALALIGSCVTLNSDVGLHVHVFDANEGALLEHFETITSRYNIALRLTVEQTELPAADGPMYYHAMRFVRLYQFLPILSELTWAIDADSLLRRDAAPLFDALESHDVGLMLLAGRIDAHRQIAAGMVGVTGTPFARKYLKLVAAYIARMWRMNRLRWGVDQVALYLVMLHLLDSGEEPRVKTVDSAMLGEMARRDSVLLISKLAPDDPNQVEFAQLYLAALAAVTAPRTAVAQ